jgi:5-methylcytosine-specific restriction enzyme subunit McrC
MTSRGPTPIISANEYGPISLPPGLDTARTRDGLVAAGLRFGVNVFESRGRRLYAQGVVGVIDIGDVIVEILPKTSDGASASDNAAFLGNLLRFAGGENKLTLALADIAIGDSGLLEVVLAWIVRTVAANLREGALRRYVPLEEYRRQFGGVLSFVISCVRDPARPLS